MERNINLPDNYDVTRNGATLRVETAKLPDEMIAALVEMALGNKVGDSAASVAGTVAESVMGQRYKALTSLKNRREAIRGLLDKQPELVDRIRAESIRAMAAVADGLYKGDWGRKRGEAEAGMTPLEVEVANIVLALAPEKFAEVRGTIKRAKAALETFGKQDDATQAKLRAEAQKRLDAVEKVGVTLTF